MSGHTRVRSTPGSVGYDSLFVRAIILTLIVAGLMTAIIWLPAVAGEPGSELSVTNVTPQDSDVTAGETLFVDVELTNTGSANATDRTVSLAVDPDYDPAAPSFSVVDETTVSLNASETTTRTLKYETESGDAEDIELLVATDDDSTQTTATVAEATLGSYSGTINASDGIDAPVGTNVTASVNGEPRDTITVETRGEYGDLEFNDSLDVEAEADADYVNFTVDGTEATNSPVLHEAAENELNLTFPDGTFGAPMAVSINDTNSELNVTDMDSVSVAVDLENTLTDTTLTQDISASVAGSTQASQEVTLDPGETDSITLTFPAEAEFDGETLAVTSDNGSDTRELAVQSELVAIEAVEDFETSHEFAGVVRDPEDLELSATLTANETPVTGNVTVRVLRDETVLYDGGQASVTDGSFTVDLDPAALPISTPPGEATVEIGNQTAGTIELTHEVQTFSEGTHPFSVPQPADVSVDGSFRATQWDAETESYSSAGLDPDGDFSDSPELHDGIYLLADEPIRVGLAFEPEDDESAPSPDQETIQPGWNLLGSNYVISSNDELSLSNDLFVGGADVDAYTPAGVRLNDSDPIYPFDAYWVYADSSTDRGTFLDGYNATARGR